ncbi:ABC-type Fe3+/spermidine/putrescine transport systems, ATPase components [Muriicola jejuensis]|uniref:ATP-binding cassette domain-containing protein n=1 Tax=Muriicola jejuensis TaxID=504488 RepID=A0A6P0U9V8_9FLAO|nr:ATP-binding cassette domain-containing protein [Muriicola jejuensis]NER10081.1 ATP-binding cassette domain-containing protein [Muriicola jejuensis]SMP03106.1 ABC-type Fe3+/spermidine/putrescine transport systems, ATPase components [Muriicola jejuensis]
MLRVDNLSFAYQTADVLEELSFVVDKGEHIAVMGESGCGKSTLLKLIYGLLTPSRGQILWNDEMVRGPLYKLVPGESYMKYLSQEFDLMPYTTVAENISQYLSVFYPKQLKERTHELLEMIEMTKDAQTKVKNLSGGQQQKVALARVLAQKPDLLLLDEPFSHIDNFRKNSLRRNLFQYLKDEKITCLTATHDHQDVLPFTDRILVLKDKALVVDGGTKKVYESPSNFYVASLFGEANTLPITLLKPYGDAKRDIIVYAHEFKVANSSGLKTKVKKVYPMGGYFLMEGDTENGRVFFHSEKELKIGSKVYLNVSIETINKRLRELP